MAIYNFYVYAYLREDGTPYYIGKGKDGRAYSKQHSVSLPKDKSKIIFIFEELSEQDAFALECLLIKYHGRKDNGTGILRNMTDGGEGSSGVIKSEEAKQKMRKPRSEEAKQNMRNKIFSDRHRKALSTARKNRKNKPFTEEHIQNLRKPKNKTRTEEHCKKISDRMKNRFISNETKELWSNQRKGKKHSEERKQKMKEAQLARWAKRNNPTIEITL
jgi:hypothetical protein